MTKETEGSQSAYSSDLGYVFFKVFLKSFKKMHVSNTDIEEDSYEHWIILH